MPRQQRTINSRGQLQKPAQRYVPDVTWIIDSVAGAVVTLALIGRTGAGFFTASPGFVFDPPQTIISQNIASEDVLTLTLDADAPAVFTLSIRGLDPGYRTNTGAFLAPAVHNWDTSPAPIPAFSFGSQDAFLTLNSVTVAPVGVSAMILSPGSDGDWVLLANEPENVVSFHTNGSFTTPDIAPGSQLSLRNTAGVWDID